ncbi:hypothetical protein OQA88_2448 [Cercophora sp. LCS_1]
MSPRSILVTGATGKQGNATINALLELSTPFTILAVTRDASSSAAKALVSKSPLIKLVEGNLNDVPTLLSTARSVNNNQPIWGVFAVLTSLGPGVTPESEIAQGKALISGAVSSGVNYFVYTSVERGGDAASWDNETPIPHFQTKLVLEKYLKETAGNKMDWCIIRPVAFMDNLEPGMKTAVFMTALRNWLGEEKKLQWVATRDVGVFAAMAFEKSDEWKGRAFGIAGDELTMGQLGDAFRRATGQEAPSAWWGLGTLLTGVVGELRAMIGWFASGGYKADVEARRREHPGLLTMEEWLVDESKFVARA